MNYFVIVKGSKVGTAILQDVVKVIRFRSVVVFYCNGGKNVIIVPEAWLLDYGPIEDEAALKPDKGVEPEAAFRKLDGIKKELDTLSKGGDTHGCTIERSGVPGDDVRPLVTLRTSPTYDDAS